MADVRITEYGEIVLNPGEQTTWWHTWTYIQPWRWVWFSAIPATANGKVEITRQWGEMDINGGPSWLVTFQNVGNVQVRFRRFAVSIGS